MLYFKIKYLHLHKNREMKKHLIIVFIVLFAFISLYLYYYYRWKSLWSLEEPRPIYSVSHHIDDTLRIVMIGDSWVEMRSDTLNKLFQAKLSVLIDRPVILKTKGKGGEKSRGIYKFMFEEAASGTKKLLFDSVDYCVVIAGINDAGANLGKKQFVYHMKLIIDFLLSNDICPIIIEIPNVNIWNVYSNKPTKDMVVDYIRSLMTGCGMYHFSEYRDALHSMLKDSGLIDSVLYIPMRGWNGDDSNLNRLFSLDDQIHLNRRGYIKLDSCVVNAVCRDLQYP